MTEKWVAVLGAGREQIPVLEAARRAGYKTVAFDGDLEAPGFTHADAFWVMSNRDSGGIVGALSAFRRVLGVVVAGTEAAVEGQEIAEALGLPNIGLAAKRCRDKYWLKVVLESAGVPCTPAGRYERFNMVSLPTIAVIKPRFGSGSRGVSLWRGGAAELQEAIRLAESVKPPHGSTQEALIERYQPGPQLSTEAIIWDGRCFLAAMVDRLYDVEKTAPMFVEFGISCPSVHDDAWRVACSELSARAAEAIGLKRGIIKLDVVLAPDGPKIIEAHPRLGPGVLQDCVRRSTGMDYLPEAVRVMCGEEPRWERLVASMNERVALHLNGGEWSWEETRKYL